MKGYDELVALDFRPIELYDYFKSYGKEMRPQMQNLRKTCLDVLYHTTSIKKAKYALLLLMNVPKDEEIRDLVMLYESDQEFSFYTIRVIASWDDGNFELFKLLKAGVYANDWALKLFEPETEEMKNWLLMKCVLSDYTAIDVFKKSGAYDLLVNNKTMSDEVYHRLSEFIYVPTNIGPTIGISYDEDYPTLLKTYLEISLEHQKTLDDYFAVGNLLSYVKEFSLEDHLSDCIALANTYIHSKGCRELLDHVLSHEGYGYGFAKYFDIPSVDKLAEYIFNKSDPHLDHLMMLSFNFHEAVAKMVPYMRKYYEETGDLDVVFHAQMGLEKHPGAGKNLVELCLKSDDESIVEMGQKILKEWQKKKTNVPPTPMFMGPCDAMISYFVEDE